MQPVNFIRTAEDVEAFWRWMSAESEVAVDTETSGFTCAGDLFSPDFRLRLIQFGSVDNAWVIDFQRWRGLVEDAFRRFDGTWLMHNASYDCKVLGLQGVKAPWHRIHDTMIMMRLAAPTEKAGLKEASVKHVSSASAGAKKVLDEAFRKQGWTWDTVPLEFPPYQFYAALDPILTSRLARTEIARRGRESPVYSLEMQVRAVCTRMEQNGLRVNAEFCEEQANGLRARAEMIKHDIQAKYGVLVTSPAQLSHYFMSRPEAREWMTKETAGGALSVDKEVLVSLIEVDGPVGEVAKATLDVRRDEKIAGSYLENFIRMRDANDLVHAQIETIAARTGRMSVREPGLQTLPKPSVESEYRIVREAVIPRDDEHVLISADFDQIELRIAAHLAAVLTGDRGLVEAFAEAERTGVDFFTTTARGVYRDTTIIKSDKRRDRIKTLSYASLYGATVRRMALAAGISPSEMRVVRDDMAKRYPGFFAVMLEIAHESKVNGGFIDTLYGRRLPITEGKDYVATNFKIQGSAADVLKRSLVTLAQAGLEDVMLLPVHDEVLFDVRREDEAEIRHLIKQSMECYEFTVPLTADPSPGSPSWAAAK
jgi:DNA polymerase I